MIGQLKKYLTNPLYRSIGIMFFLGSLVFGFWVTRIPEVKQSLGLSEGMLGLALFFSPMGAVLSMLVSPGLLSRFGVGRVTTITAVVLYLASVFPVMAFNYTFLCAALFFHGLAVGMINVAANNLVGVVEKQDGVLIMATSHGFFSLGGIFGAALGGVLAAYQVDAVMHFTISNVSFAAIIWWYVRKHVWHLADEVKAKGPALVLPARSVWALALISFCVLLGEGAIADWSSVYLKEFLNSDAYVAGMGYAAYSLTMTLGRFNGDALTQRYGSGQILTWGFLIALTGIMMVVLGSTWIVISGFALAGIGYSCIVPVLMSNAAKKDEVSSAHGVASVASMGFVGFLVGPVAIGFIAEGFGLNVGFLLLVLLNLFSILLSRRSLATVKSGAKS
ncbi:MAG: MFS transporter [Cyclobacteriaceae bacterium]|nr:MFS transporter [Cyclobacteriaceae bacterium]